MDQTDKAKIIPHLEYLEKELQFLESYRKEIDWDIYQTQRKRRLEVERWVECLINATLDLSKMVLAIKDEDVPETSRELLFKIGANIYKREVDAEEFSELAKIRNTLAHRYLDMRWHDIKRFFQIAHRLFPSFLKHIKGQIK